MSWTSFKLGGIWYGSWPDYVDVISPDSAEHIIYVPERTCELTFKRGAMYDVARYSCCGYEFPELVSETAVAENYCPNCGARVVEP